MAKAMNLEREPQSVRDRYGKGQATDKSFGGAPQDPQQFLPRETARRSGSPLRHGGLRRLGLARQSRGDHPHSCSRKYLPVFDRALSVFLEDLDERGLLETTTVIVWGEFGRTPKINPKGGRDHWPNTQSVLIARRRESGEGGVIGETDAVGWGSGRPARSRPGSVCHPLPELRGSM